jgi:hypothetical protein
MPIESDKDDDEFIATFRKKIFDALLEGGPSKITPVEIFEENELIFMSYKKMLDVGCKKIDSDNAK